MRSLLQTSSNPIIVKIVEPKKDGLAEVLIGALGLTGVQKLIDVEGTPVALPESTTPTTRPAA